MQIWRPYLRSMESESTFYPDSGDSYNRKVNTTWSGLTGSGCAECQQHLFTSIPKIFELESLREQPRLADPIVLHDKWGKLRPREEKAFAQVSHPGHLKCHIVINIPFFSPGGGISEFRPSSSPSQAPQELKGAGGGPGPSCPVCLGMHRGSSSSSSRETGKRRQRTRWEATCTR